jgi:hypothetical protein
LTVRYRDVVEDPQALAEMLQLTHGNRRMPVLVEAEKISIGFGGA